MLTQAAAGKSIHSGGGHAPGAAADHDVVVIVGRHIKILTQSEEDNARFRSNSGPLDPGAGAAGVHFIKKRNG